MFQRNVFEGGEWFKIGRGKGGGGYLIPSRQ